MKKERLKDQVNLPEEVEKALNISFGEDVPSVLIYKAMIMAKITIGVSKEGEDKKVTLKTIDNFSNLFHNFLRIMVLEETREDMDKAEDNVETVKPQA